METYLADFTVRFQHIDESKIIYIWHQKKESLHAAALVKQMHHQ